MISKYRYLKNISEAIPNISRRHYNLLATSCRSDPAAFFTQDSEIYDFPTTTLTFSQHALLQDFASLGRLS